jgi:hypothetical protein
MNAEELHATVLAFFENIEKYYGCKTEITEGLFSEIDNLDNHLTTWSLSEFDLVRSAYRKKGLKFMMEGANRYYEISADKIIELKQPGRHKTVWECFGLLKFGFTVSIKIIPPNYINF